MWLPSALDDLRSVLGKEAKVSYQALDIDGAALHELLPPMLFEENSLVLLTYHTLEVIANLAAMLPSML